MINNEKFDILDDDESKIVQMIENNEFIAAENIEDRTSFWQNAVKETTKRKSIHLKIQERDIQKIRTIAYKKGIPYQTLIGSIIHQYAQGAT
jgi:predicted DNA binding CopG/RHH family protein